MDISNIIQISNEKNSFSKSFNESLIQSTNSSIMITPLSIIKDDIKNMRILSEIQIAQISTFSEKEIMDIIELYNVIIEQIQFIL